MSYRFHTCPLIPLAMSGTINHTCTRYIFRLVSTHNTNTMCGWFGNPSSFGAAPAPV